jgi:hypothetical protein
MEFTDHCCHLEGWGTAPARTGSINRRGKGIGFKTLKYIFLDYFLSLQIDTSRTSGQNNSDNNGIYVKQVLPDSLAGRSGQICAGDRLLEINGQSFVGFDHVLATAAIYIGSEAGMPVTFLLQRPNRIALVPPSTRRASFFSSITPLSSPLHHAHHLDVPFGDRRHSTSEEGKIKKDNEVDDGSAESALASSSHKRSETAEDLVVLPSTKDDTASTATATDNPFLNDSLKIWEEQVRRRDLSFK